jgi:hypothetical protein
MRIIEQLCDARATYLLYYLFELSLQRVLKLLIVLGLLDYNHYGLCLRDIQFLREKELPFSLELSCTF